MAWLVAVRTSVPSRHPFAEELSFAENPDDGFLAVLGQDRDLDLALLDEEHRVGDVALAEDLLVFGVSLDGFARTGLAQKTLGIERVSDLEMTVCWACVGPLPGGSTTLSVTGESRMAARQSSKHNPVMYGRRLNCG